MTSNKIELMNKYIKDLYDLSNSFNLYEEYISLQNKVELLTNQNIKLTEELNKKNKELSSKNEELSNLTKVSYIQSISKQLTEKDNQISQLENQINKLRKMVEVIEVTPIIESVEEPIKESVEEHVEEKEFDPDNFEEIEGYELIMYKKNYYLKDLENLTIHTIINDTVGDEVGYINSSGKIKLNKK